MAQSVKIILTDDLDGSTATSTVNFGLDGKNYEIDLNDENAENLRDALESYIKVARRVAGSSNRGTRRSSGTGTSKEEMQAIREWAKNAGMDVSERGRISSKVLEAYHAANG